MVTAAWRLTESYSDSAKRSYKAGVTLVVAGDTETAAHLFGIAGECAVKAALDNAGINVDRASGLRHHFPTLRSAVLRHGRTRHMKRLLGCLSASPAVLDGYNIDTRYAANASIGQARCASWHSDVKTIFAASGIVI